MFRDGCMMFAKAYGFRELSDLCSYRKFIGETGRVDGLYAPPRWVGTMVTEIASFLRIFGITILGISVRIHHILYGFQHYPDSPWIVETMCKNVWILHVDSAGIACLAIISLLIDVSIDSLSALGKSNTLSEYPRSAKS